VTEENVPRSEHVIIPADNINSRCTSCGETILTGGADTEQSKIANTPRKNSEINSFQNRGAKFGSIIIIIIYNYITVISYITSDSTVIQSYDHLHASQHANHIRATSAQDELAEEPFDRKVGFMSSVINLFVKT
jgi:hypothetical protein